MRAVKSVFSGGDNGQSAQVDQLRREQAKQQADIAKQDADMAKVEAGRRKLLVRGASLMSFVEDGLQTKFGG